jgi:hypothetical protein
MQRNASQAFYRLCLFALLSGSILSIALILQPAARAADDAPLNKNIAELISFGHKFRGTASCKSCHGDAAGDPGAPAKKGSEMTVWSTVDKHHESYATLSNDKSKAIASKGGYGEATTSAVCLSCHALNIPDALKAADFDIKEGNDCDSCHGPAELWATADGTPHKNKGWAQKRRDADGYDPVVKAKDDGFWDGRVPSLRADNCASCHLSIDTKMVAAGHPQPAFELNEYAAQIPKHWTDKRSDQYTTQLWAAGQVVCARDAMAQLAKRISGGDPADAVKAAYDQAMAHGSMLQILVETDGGVGSEVKDDLDKAMTTLKAGPNADAATAVSAAADKVYSTDLKDFAPDATATGAFLTKVLAESDDLAKNYGRRGAEQAAYAARWLYLSKAWDASTKKELPDDVVAAYKGFFDNRANPLGDDAAKFADAIAKIKGNP